MHSDHRKILSLFKRITFPRQSVCVCVCISHAKNEVQYTCNLT